MAVLLSRWVRGCEGARVGCGAAARGEKGRMQMVWVGWGRVLEPMYSEATCDGGAAARRMTGLTHTPAHSQRPVSLPSLPLTPNSNHVQMMYVHMYMYPPVDPSDPAKLPRSARFAETGRGKFVRSREEGQGWVRPCCRLGRRDSGSVGQIEARPRDMGFFVCLAARGCRGRNGTAGGRLETAKHVS
ncbi:hypothetical protein BT67DRAFT_245705 [Trichocladium antarcticum]|uniref:Uncharacterized protein n=1 Tax=Trichocladium antarcticum TaxID=1450529 RepID=A0AAN6Z9I2_9PEZI|nr:hypothetical protein BT67DRAFT_245705 [Trichocladium antarcticum]